MKRPRSWLAAGLLALITQFSAAETTLLYAANTESGPNKFEFEFPVIELPNGEAARLVNLYLHHLILGTLPPVAGTAEARGEKRITLREADATVSMASLDVTEVRLRNGDRVLTVKIRAEGCGAYCESYDEHYAFDARTGRVLVMEEILTSQGKRELGNLAKAAHKRAVRDALAEGKRKLRAGTKDKEERERLISQQDTYTRCLENLASSDYLGAMTVGDGELIFVGSRCSNHANLATDDLGKLMFAANGQNLRRHLTPYGRSLILQDGDAQPSPVNPFSQVFEGKIDGRMPVTFFFTSTVWDAKPFASATYYYDRYRVPIQLGVDKTARGWTMTEKPKNAPVSAYGVDPKADLPKLELSLNGRTLAGTWSAKGRVLSFSATAPGR